MAFFSSASISDDRDLFLEGLTLGPPHIPAHRSRLSGGYQFLSGLTRTGSATSSPSVRFGDYPVDRTAVFIGRTGSGKSSCSNALAGEDFLFGVSNKSVSKTKYVEAKTVSRTWSKSHNVDRQYRIKIVDTIGIGDTDLTQEEVLHRLADACHKCREGINAVYFVTGDRFTKEEADAFDLLWQVLFGAEVLDYTTIVRTKFDDYNDPTAIRRDQRDLKLQRGDVSRIVSKIKNSTLYVDIPPKKYGRIEDRKRSGDILMDHLIVKSQGKFCPPVLGEVKRAVSNHIKAEKRLANQVEQLQHQIDQMQGSYAQMSKKLQLQREVTELERKKAHEHEAVVQNMNRIVERRGRCERTLSSVGKAIDRCSVM